MNIITSVSSTADNKYIFGGDLNGILYIWNLKNVYLEHLNRQEEVQKNTNVYSYTQRFKIINDEIHNVLVTNRNVLISSDKEIMKFELSTFLNYINEVEKKGNKNPNLVDFSEQAIQNQMTSIKQIKSNYFEITQHLVIGNQLMIGCLSGKVFIIEINKDDLQFALDTNKYINDSIDCQVLLSVNPVTCLCWLGQNNYVFGSKLGLLQIWKEEQFYTILKQKQILSPVIKVEYLSDSQTLYSLHENYICIWNMVLLSQTHFVEKKNCFDMLLVQNKVLFGGEGNKLRIMNLDGEFIAQELDSSSNYVLKITKLNDQKIVLVNGSSPFIDVFNQMSYQFTLCCI